MVKNISRQLNGFKKGFSLAEVLISMLIMSVAFLALTKVVTQKPQKQLENTPHGFYECFKEGGQIYEHRTRNNVAQELNKVDSCIFEPPKGVYYINIHYIDNESYYNTVETMFDETVTFNEPSKVLDAIPEVNSEYIIDHMEDDRPMFKSYLQLSHPSSYIYQNWINSDTPPSDAMFIAW